MINPQSIPTQILPKRVHMAIVESNIPRLRELLMVSYRAGSSVVALLEKVKQAAQRKYSPKSYNEAQYQLGYQIPNDIYFSR
ncbi:hypothetical protein HYPSUDRAFT_36451 [Hypholoma sublateritium FD-334 SS-4]|uniref:Uncharacterized protein n=1 Tax=Hypholoma sublateritium (strain FD-334 SS-4) TaxID=945553 RepID=A0A0D2PCF1_HYPSF|nr:hypothetical protein HYPSUDRAFT_36451 [Hypholoma sublateritium FD-334 SS-4]